MRSRNEFLPLAKPYITKDEINAASEVIQSGYWTTGPKVTEFETAFTDYLSEDVDLHAVALNSCTAGLHLSLLALGIEKGDEVIVPTWTFAATAQVVEWIGAKLVLCDIDENSLNIDIRLAEKLITHKTKAIIAVHMAGYPCDIDALQTLAQKHNLKVIEDAAHAIGTKYSGKKIGNFSDATVYSFYATKNLAMGEGGAVVSKDVQLIEKIRELSYFNINKEAFKRYNKSGNWFYDIEGIGYKYNLDSMHAAIGLTQLKKLDYMNNKRRQIAKSYKKNLHPNISFTKDNNKHFHTYHLFPIKIPRCSLTRDDLIFKLRDKNIGTSVHFRPIHLHSFYNKRFNKDDFPIANKLYGRILSIPMFPSMEDEDVEYVIKNLNNLTGQ